MNITVNNSLSNHFSIKNSDIGTTEFLNVDATQFQTVEIEDSIVMNVLPINFEIENIKSKDSKNRKEIYRQLKYAFQKSGDNYKSMQFAAGEMKELFHNYKWFSKHFIDKFILWTRKSNNYDQNWLKPLLLLLAIIFPIYFNILYQLEVPYVFNETFAIKDILGKYLLFLNPTHKPDFIKGFNLNSQNSTIALDYICRLLSGYFIYQIVKAFRKMKE